MRTRQLEAEGRHAAGCSCSSVATGPRLHPRAHAALIPQPTRCAGDCAALAYDSVTPTSVIGLPMLAAPPAYMSPYCVAINKQAAGGDLEQRLAWALTGCAGSAVGECMGAQRQRCLGRGRLLAHS